MARVTHILGNKKLQGEVENPVFILTNKIGGYASFSPIPLSRYQGVFFNQGDMYKVLENILPLDAPEVTALTNYGSWVEQERGNLKEGFIFPFSHNTLIYELSETKEILLVLDCKKAYDDRQFGRYYSIKPENGKLVISFTKKTDNKEDNSNGRQEFQLFLVIDEAKNYSVVDTFLPVQYPFDKERGSHPTERYVYHAVKIKAKQLVLSFSTKKEEAMKENIKMLNHFAGAVHKQKYRPDHDHHKPIKDTPVEMAYHATRNSLDQLTCSVDGQQGIYAGLWWFFQFWSRDQAVSLKAWMLQGNYQLAKEFLLQNLRQLKPDGRLPNRWPASDLGSADSIYWTVKRIRDLLDLLQQEGLLHKYFNAEDLLFVKNKLETAMISLFKNHTKEEFDTCTSKETWMDTSWKEDARSGMRIEQQALRLAFYKALRLLCKEQDDGICYRLAAQHEEILREKVRQYFFRDGYLWDGVNDPTIRPNIFIAYYVYPDLLSADEWKSCFRTVLPKLLNEWGGLATIAKDHSLYCDTHTGVDNRSYHRGDSWYWLNNLAAICLARVSRFTFRKEIRSILEASTQEILWSGAIGHHAEISSSKQRESKGCLMQAWSAAMYIELVEELF